MRSRRAARSEGGVSAACRKISSIRFHFSCGMVVLSSALNSILNIKAKKGAGFWRPASSFSVGLGGPGQRALQPCLPDPQLPPNLGDVDFQNFGGILGCHASEKSHLDQLRLQRISTLQLPQCVDCIVLSYFSRGLTIFRRAFHKPSHDREQTAHGKAAHQYSSNALDRAKEAPANRQNNVTITDCRIRRRREIETGLP